MRALFRSERFFYVQGKGWYFDTREGVSRWGGVTRDEAEKRCKVYLLGMPPSPRAMRELGWPAQGVAAAP